MLPIEQIHPALVHFPIVLALILVSIDAVATSRGRLLAGSSPLASISALLATAMGSFVILTYLFGDQAYDVALASGTPQSVLEIHQQLGTITTIAMALWGAIRSGLWWRQVPFQGNTQRAIVGVEVVISGLVLFTAFFGGQLVYEHGVGVLGSLSG